MRDDEGSTRGTVERAEDDTRTSRFTIHVEAMLLASLQLYDNWPRPPSVLQYGGLGYDQTPIDDCIVYMCIRRHITF